MGLVYADNGTAGGPGSLIGTFIPFAIIAVMFYFILLRPEMKRRKEQNKMMGELKKGDKIVTSSGIMGSISAINDDVITLLICDNVKIKMKKNSVTEVNKKG